MDRRLARMARNALMLALLCVVGMFSLPLGENVKVSLQLLVVFIIALTAESWIDASTVCALYLLLGLFLPVYAGFTAGVGPTLGYVLSFAVICPVIHFMNKIPKLPSWLRMGLACLSSLPVVYAIGTVFMMCYLGKYDLGPLLLVSVVPYVPFDLAKVALGVALTCLLPASMRPKGKGSDNGDRQA